MDSNYNIEFTNRIYHALCNHDKELFIKSYVDRDTKYIDKIEFRLYEDGDYPYDCPFASIFVEIRYAHRWGSTDGSVEIYGKISGLEETNSESLKHFINNEFDGLLIKYRELNPTIRTNTITPTITVQHSTSSHTTAMYIGTKVEIKFEIEKSSYLEEDIKLEIENNTVLCLDALKDVSKQLKSVKHHHCSDPDHHSEQIYS